MIVRCVNDNGIVASQNTLKKGRLYKVYRYDRGSYWIGTKPGDGWSKYRFIVIDDCPLMNILYG